MAGVKSLIFDTDGGVDDCAALWWALTDPDVDLLAVTTTAGAVAEDVAAVSALKVLAAAGRPDVPVAVGRPGRVGATPFLEPVHFIHGLDGQGDADHPAPVARPVAEPAEDLLRRLVHERPGEVSVVATAPLTNLARVIDADAGWPGQVASLVVMGGSVAAGGNAQPAAEANIAGDPHAAAVVVGAEGWRRPPMMVGLDATHRATLTEAEFELLAERRTPAARFLHEPLLFYRRFGSTFTRPDCPCHDLLAMLAWADPAVLTEAPELPLAVVTSEGPAWGATVADRRAPVFAALEGGRQASPAGFRPWRVALEPDVDRFRRHVRRLFGR